ncbi:MAG: xanthine dehydrogenase accessory factor [Anaerolineaceae bacterium]|nr:MAG: xanthine dehydrogenase accessory factor [Anaerolineaceae bacterium]
MRDILSDVEKWIDAGETIALATVTLTWGSAPRKIGAHMAFTPSGKITGSVSGGCVENAVIEAGLQTLQDGKPQLLHFGVADEDAWGVGLMCGGSIDVFVQPLDVEIFYAIKKAVENEELIVHAVVVKGADDALGKQALIQQNRIQLGSLGAENDARILELSADISATRQTALDEETQVFINVMPPPTTLVIVGGVQVAVALATFAKTIGYKTILVDPRKAWGNETRFPHVDQLIQLWIDEAFARIEINSSVAVTVLTHDPKIDDPALKAAVESSAFYIGALGSKKANAKRIERLRNDGVSEAQIARIHAPIGLDIGAQNPEEIALAIMAQIVQSFRKQNQAEAKQEARRDRTP